jgi:cell volume regulation protein A
VVAASVILLACAAVILAGFLAGRFFERSRFPDVPILLGLGLLIGPLNRWAAGQGFGIQELADGLSSSNLHAVAPLATGLALVVLLFDSSMDLEFKSFGRNLGPAAAHTLPILLCTVLFVASVAWALGMPLLLALMLGVAMVNVDQAVSAGVLPRMRISESVRATYLLEMAFYDLLSIPILVALIAAAGGGGQIGSVNPFVSLLSTSLAIGIGAGLCWVFALRLLHEHPHSYMLTFAAILATYASSELLGGSGALSILLFGLLIGNRAWVMRRFGRRLADDEHRKVHAFHAEITFFVRTLYFLFLGASVAPPAAGGWPVTVPGLGKGTTVLVAAALLILAAIVAARLLPIWLASLRKPERRRLAPVFGRGLDTAVLATLPFIAPGFVAGTRYHDMAAPWEGIFVDLAFVTILSTVVASSLFVYFTERGAPPKDEKPEKPRPARPEGAVALPARPRSPGAK